MKEHIDVTITLTQRLYQDWNLRNYYSGGRLVLFICLAAFWILIAAVNILFMALDARLDFLVVALIFLFPLLLSCLPLVIRVRSGRIFRADKFMQDRQLYRIDAEGFTVTSERARAEISWSDVHRVRFHKGLTVVFIAKLRAFLFPHAAFAAPEDLADFHSLLKAHVPAEKIK